MLEPLPSEPTIGVYALTYNHEDFIAEAIESVLAQGWPSDRLNFVLLDDGSTDATPERVKPYEKYLTYVRQENQGINAAATRLVGLVEGDLLVPMSCDDALAPDRFERLLAYYGEHPDVGMTYGDMEAINAQSKVFVPSVLKATKNDPLEGQIAGRLLKGNFISGGSLALRGVLKQVILPMPAEVAWEDWWFAWALTNVAPVGFIDAVVYRYRQHSSNFMLGIGTRSPDLSVKRMAAEIPFRRFLLGNARPGTCNALQLFEATEALRAMARGLTEKGVELETLLPMTDGQKAVADRLAADAVALSARSPVLAAFAAARAIAANPMHNGAFRTLHGLAGTPSTHAPAFFDDVRSVTVFAEAEELVSDPALLRAYAEAFGPDDDVTLIAIAREWDGNRLGAELGPVFDRVMGEAAPDVLALPADTAAWQAGLTQADCVLGGSEVPGVERFTEPGPLREYVELRRRLPRRRS